MTNTPYHVQIAPTAIQAIKQLDAKHRNLIMKLIEALAINPRPPGSNKLDGMTGLYCEQINAHRIIYKIEEQDVLILVIK